jgi:hypothetical protein
VALVINPQNAQNLLGVFNVREYGAKGDGVTDDTAAIRLALAAAASAAVAGYGSSAGAVVEFPPGVYAISDTLTYAERVTIRGAGPRVTSIIALTPFAGNCLIRNAVQDSTQEWGFVEGLSISGHYYAQANGGGATTVTTATFRPNPTLGFSLGVVSTAGYATAGTLDVGGKRVIYGGITGNTFTGCQVISVNGNNITVGDAVTPITTNNVQGLQIVNLYANSSVRDVQINQTSGEGLYVGGATNCVDFNNLWVNLANRDCILISGQPDANNWSKITAQYPAQNGTVGTFACIHVLGQTGSTANIQFQGSLKLDSLFFESNVQSTYGLWLENIGNVSVDTARLQGGGSNYTGQVCVQIDSSQTSPLTQDSLHSSPILLQNLTASEIVNGRKVLVDNVRSRDSGTGATAPSVISRYTTEDTSPGVAAPWAANMLYWAGQLCTNLGNVYQAKVTFVSGASFAATNWKLVTDREHAMRIGTLTAFRESATELQAWGSTLTATSATQVGAPVPVLQGESYDHVVFVTGSTSATFGTNNDGHWHVDMRDGAPKRNECLRFWRGDQYCYVNAENYLVKQSTVTNADGSGKPSHRVRTVRNLIVDVVAHEVSAATQNPATRSTRPRPTPTASPQRPSQQVADWGYDEWKVRKATVKAVTYAVVADEGFAWPYFDNTIGPFLDDGEGGTSSGRATSGSGSSARTRCTGSRASTSTTRSGTPSSTPSRSKRSTSSPATSAGS